MLFCNLLTQSRLCSVCILFTALMLLNSCNTEVSRVQETEARKERKMNFEELKKDLKCREMIDSCHAKLRIAKELHGELIILNRKDLERRLVGKYLSCQAEYFLKTELDTIWVDGYILAIPHSWKIKESIIRISRYYYR